MIGEVTVGEKSTVAAVKRRLWRRQAVEEQRAVETGSGSATGAKWESYQVKYSVHVKPKFGACVFIVAAR